MVYEISLPSVWLNHGTIWMVIKTNSTILVGMLLTKNLGTFQGYDLPMLPDIKGKNPKLADYITGMYPRGEKI